VRTVPIPPDGLYRVSRWEDVERFPHPAPSIAPLALTEPLTDGPRWEDANGQFATVKCSRTSVAAIGRVFARYRPRIIELPVDPAADPDLYGGIVNRMLRFFTHEPDNDQEPELVEGVVPAEIFPRLCEIHLPASLDLSFIDIEDPATLREIAAMYGETIERLGLPPIEGNNLARESDRRLPRLVLTLLYVLHSETHAGVRIAGQPDEDWESFVLWSPPDRVDLRAHNDMFRWVGPWDEDAIRAANHLGVRLPDA
jgi:hypothetical protein